MTINMIKELGKRMYVYSEKLEVFIQELENIKSQTKLRNMKTEIKKNTRRNEQVDSIIQRTVAVNWKTE